MLIICAICAEDNSLLSTVCRVSGQHNAQLKSHEFLHFTALIHVCNLFRSSREV